MKEKKEKETNIIDRVFSPQRGADEVETENVSKIIEEWLSPKHINAKTRFTKEQVVAVAILQSLANTYHIRTLDRFLKEFRVGKLSEDGQSSKELENILKSRIIEEDTSHLKSLTKFLE